MRGLLQGVTVGIMAGSAGLVAAQEKREKQWQAIAWETLEEIHHMVELLQAQMLQLDAK